MRNVATVLILLCGTLPRCTAEVDATFPVLFDRLKTWIVENGGYVNPKLAAVERAFSGSAAAAGNDRGVTARASIAEGELLLMAPYACLLRRSLVAKDPLVTSVRTALSTHRDECGSFKHKCDLTIDPSWGGLQQLEIAVWLAKEVRNLTSQWRPLLDIFPQHFSSSFLVVNEVYVKEALSNTELLGEVLETRAVWKKAHDFLSASLPAYREHVPSYEDFRHARLNILSRVHALGNQGPGSEHTIVPILDLLNHEHQAPTQWRESKEQGGFIVRAIAAIPKDSAITTSYGDHRSSKDLVLHHDFAPATNPGDEVSFKATAMMDDSDPLYSQKRSVLLAMDVYRSFLFSGADGFAASGSPIRATPGSSLEDTMLDEIVTFLRVAVMDPRDFDREVDAMKAVQEGGELAVERLLSAHAVIDDDLERRAAARLAETCDANLARLGQDRGAAEILEVLLAFTVEPNEETIGQRPPDLQNIATTAASYLGGQRKLHIRVREAARVVQKLAETDAWPLHHEHHSRTETFHGDEQVSALVRRWVRLYSVATKARGGRSGTEL